MTDWFVGFRPLVKKPRGTKTARVSRDFSVTAPVAEVFTVLTSREGIDRIIDETVRFDARHGGKLRFLSQGDVGYGGTYSLIRVGKKVVLLTERHGELTFYLAPSQAGALITLSASRLVTTDQAQEWESSLDQILSRLADVLGEDR